MPDGPDIAEIAALIGDPARAAMLVALTDGRAQTAGELARLAGVTPQTASAHLAKMAAGGLLALERQGRHRYYRLASAEVADAIEALEALAPMARPRRLPGPREAALRHCRSCYDHLAGRVAVNLVDTMAARGWIAEHETAFELTDPGGAALQALGFDPARARARRRGFAPRCLDWSERRAHLGGALGAMLMARFEADGWIERSPGSRVVRVTGRGVRALRDAFGLAAA